MKFLVFKRKTAVAAACVLAAALMFTVVNHPRHRGGGGHCPAAPHLLRSAGPENGGHLLRRGMG